jgi:hypothetical protein
VTTSHRPNERAEALSFQHVGVVECPWMGYRTDLMVGAMWTQRNMRVWGKGGWTVTTSHIQNKRT